MAFYVHYPNSGTPYLRRFSDSPAEAQFIGTLEPCDPTDLELDTFDWYLSKRPGFPEPGTVIRIGLRTFACVRASIVVYYHLS